MKKIFTLLFFAILGLNNLNAATFSSIASAAWSVGTTWTVTSGVDANNIPDADDNVTINGGHSVNLTGTSDFNTLVINAGGILVGNNQAIRAKGNFTIFGSVTGTLKLYIQGVCVFSSSANYTAPGDWYIQSGSLTITAGTSINKNNFIIVSSGISVTNNGTVTGSIQLNGSGKWINGAGSNLNSVRSIAGTGVLTATAVPNTVTYINSLVTAIKPATYYNLVINAASTKSLTANLIVLNNFTLGTGSANILNMNNFNLTVGGNWINNANTTILNQAITNFNGSGVQTISRASNEVFNNLTLDGTGTVLLNRSITVNQNITMTSGTLDPSASNFTVNVAGNFINNGGTIAQRGVINFNGSAAQTISGTATAGFFNVNSINSHPSGVSVTSTILINNILTVPSGIFGTSGAGVITIPATAATTYGRIGTIAGTLTGTGWNVESYIDGPVTAYWQMLSTTINGNLLSDWDNDPRFYMSGIGGNDGQAAGFKSVRTYSEITNSYTNITSATTPLLAGRGYYIWMGDNMTQLIAPLVYNSIGTPNFGNISFPVTSGGAGAGYNLVGNPYACPINFSAVVASSGNLEASFVILQENGTYATDPNGGIIAPNQGFMCVANAAGNIQFTESAKNTVTNPNILKSSAKTDAITISVFNNINGLGGQTNIEFSENATDNFVQSQDLRFIASPYEEADNIWTNSIDNTSLLRNVLYSNNDEKLVPLTIKSGVYGVHHLSVKGLSNLNTYNSVWLEDLTTGKKINLIKEQSYSFNAEEIGKEYNFVLHFSKKEKPAITNETLPVNTLNENTSVYNTESNVVVKFDMKEMTPVKISVYSLSGQLVFESIDLNVTNDKITLPLQKENSLYLLIIQSEGQQITRKIMY